MTSGSEGRSDTRPNILLILSDQHRYDCLGLSGARETYTPNLDRLAGERVRFTRVHARRGALVRRRDPVPVDVAARAHFPTVWLRI